MGRIEAILLAAGYSSRMGRLKSLLPIGGAQVKRASVDTQSGISRGPFRCSGDFKISVKIGTYLHSEAESLQGVSS